MNTKWNVYKANRQWPLGEGNLRVVDRIISGRSVRKIIIILSFCCEGSRENYFGSVGRQNSNIILSFKVDILNIKILIIEVKKLVLLCQHRLNRKPITSLCSVIVKRKNAYMLSHYYYYCFVVVVVVVIVVLLIIISICRKLESIAPVQLVKFSCLRLSWICNSNGRVN